MTQFFDVFETALPRHSANVWMRGGEPGMIDPSEYNERSFRILITRLSTYEDTSLSFTHNLLYALCASHGWFPDTAFLPPERGRAFYKEQNIPWLTGIQTKRSFLSFDLIAFSNSISQELCSIFQFLLNSGIPLEKTARMNDESIPLIILGGANASSASVFLCAEPPVDGMFTGEDIDTIAELFDAVNQGKKEGLTKREILPRLHNIPGFFEPDKPQPVKKLNVRRPIPAHLYASMPLNFAPGNAGKAVLPISEGCAGFCSFCSESFARKPYREQTVEEVVETALSVKTAAGASKLDLFSFNFNMHKGFYSLVEQLIPIFPQIGLKSQRFDSIAEDPSLIDVEKLLGKNVFTCGLEGISDRMRAFLNKNLSGEQVKKSIEVLVNASVREIKVFLIACGREEQCDFEEWAAFLEWASQVRTPQGRQVRFVFSVTPLVRFPHTPLEFDHVPPIEAMETIIRKITGAAVERGFECRCAAPVHESYFCDMLVRASHPQVYDAFKKTMIETGFLYETSVPRSIYDKFLDNLSFFGLEPEQCAQEYSFDFNARTQWALLDLGVSRQYLQYQFNKNTQYLQIQPDASLLCGKGRPRYEHYKMENLRSLIAQGQRGEFEISFVCTIGERWRGLSREYPAVMISRALMSAVPSLAPLYRGFSRSKWQDNSEKPAAVSGLDSMTFRFRSDARQLFGSGDLPNDVLLRLEERLAGSDICIIGIDRGAEMQCRFVIQFEGKIDTSYFAKNGLKYTLSKKDSGSHVYELSKDSLKKRILVSLETCAAGSRNSPNNAHDAGTSITAAGSRSCAVVVPGPKFCLQSFLSEALSFADRRSKDEVLVTAEPL